MTEEGGLSEGRRPRLLSGRAASRCSALSGRVGLTCESSVREEMIGLEFSHTAYFLISLNYLLNIL